jgi:hypothetical protein
MRSVLIAAAIGAVAISSAAAGDLPTNPEVTQETVQQTICVRGYTRTIRPPVAYTNRVKQHLMRQEGLPLELIGDKILDHKIALENGGSPAALANFILQDRDDSFAKDHVEDCLRVAICSGRVSLREAQQAVWRDWRTAATLCSR